MTWGICPGFPSFSFLVSSQYIYTCILICVPASHSRSYAFSQDGTLWGPSLHYPQCLAHKDIYMEDTVGLRLVLSWQGADTMCPCPPGSGSHVLQDPGSLDRQVGTRRTWRACMVQTGIVASEELHCGQQGPLLMAVGPSSDTHPFPCLGLFLTLP